WCGFGAGRGGRLGRVVSWPRIDFPRFFCCNLKAWRCTRVAAGPEARCIEGELERTAAFVPLFVRVGDDETERRSTGAGGRAVLDQVVPVVSSLESPRCFFESHAHGVQRACLCLARRPYVIEVVVVFAHEANGER